MIYLRKPLTEINKQMISNSSYKNIRVRPFPKSTLLLQEYSKIQQTGYSTSITMQFLARDLTFRMLNLTSYVDSGEYELLYEVKLNSSSLGSAECRDLSYIKRGTPKKGEFYVFCRYFREKIPQEGSRNADDDNLERMISIVYINRTEMGRNESSDQIVREYTFSETSMAWYLDFNRGFKNLRLMSYGDNGRYANFQAFTPFLEFFTVDPVIFRLDCDVFVQMAELNQTYLEGESIVEITQYFSIKSADIAISASEMMILSQDFTKNESPFYYAMLSKDRGTIICKAPQKQLGDISVKFINCHIIESQVIPHPQELEPVALFIAENLAQDEENVEKFFYAISIKPPAIIEYDMEDPNNVQINKVYKVNNQNDQYIGTLQISMNNNYIMHLLTNPLDNSQLIRVFCRNSNFNSMAKFEIALNKDTVVDFFTFPNMFFNLIIFRDERSINTTSLTDISLVLNGTNATLIEKYKNQEIQVIVYIMQQIEVIMQQFTVTFVDKYNTTIVSAHKQFLVEEDIEVFYNCGELEWSYTISDYVNGPNYNLTLQQDENNQSLSYFNFENQDLKLIQRANFNFSRCHVNYLFPFYHQTVYNRNINATDDDSRSTILICINSLDSSVSSYLLQRGDKSDFQLTNEILMPGLKFVDYSYDLEERTIFLLAENPAYANLNQSIVEGRYEMHTFRVYNEIIWNNNFTLRAHNITIFSYNYIDKKCVFVEYLKAKKEGIDDMEVIRIYDFNFEAMQMNVRAGNAVTIRNAAPETRIIKAQMSSEYILFTLTEDRRICLYLKGKRVERVKEIIVKDIVNFDIYDNRYLFIYYGQRTIDVYEIIMYMRLDYYMRIPLYKDYEDFTFAMVQEPNQIVPNIVRTYKYGNFHVLLQSPLTGQTNLLVFCVQTNQHNSFILTRDFTSQFNSTQKSSFQRIFLTGEKDQLVIGTITDDLIQLFDAQYANKITLRENTKKELIERCKDIKIQYTAGLIVAWAVQIDQVRVWPESLFISNRPEPQPIQQLGLQLKISSINQGMVPSAKSNQDRQVSILFSSENPDTSGPYSILHETYIEGQALNYQAKCNFKDKDGKIHDCTSATVEETRDAPYSFPIEFATSSRSVQKSFTLGQLYFMFDSLNQVIVSRLPLYQNLLDGVDGMALIKLYQGMQQNIFGCNLDFFSSTFKMVDFSRYFDMYRMIKDEETGEVKKVYPLSYLMFYHCVESQETLAWDLKVTLINVYPIPKTFDESEAFTILQQLPFEVYQIYEKISIPQEIIDIEVFNLRYQLKYKDEEDEFTVSKLKFALAISCKMPKSYSNVLLFYGVQMAIRDQNLEISLFNSEPITANNLKLNTFKIGKLLSIRKSNLLVGVLEDYGAMIFNLTQMMDQQLSDATAAFDYKLPPLEELVLATISLPPNKTFDQQHFRLKGPIQVSQVSANPPHTLTFITNWGLIVLNFRVDLTNVTDIRNLGYKAAFTPNTTRHMFLDFDTYRGEIASNEYGSVFLVEKYFYGDNYMTYLVALSYYSAMNTRIFKIVNMTQNEHCFSLNLDSYYVSSPEDQIAVSFICSAYLQIYRVCMRPHLVVDLEPLARRELNALQFDSISNNFEITIEATNVFTQGDLNRDSVNLEMVYVLNRNDKLQVFFAIGAVATCALLFLIIYIDMKMNASETSSKSKDDDRQTSIIRSPFSDKNLHSSTYLVNSHASSALLRGGHEEQVLFEDGSPPRMNTVSDFNQADYALNRTMTVDTIVSHPSFVQEQSSGMPKAKVVSAYTYRPVMQQPLQRQIKIEEDSQEDQQLDDDNVPRFPDLRLSEKQRQNSQSTRKSRATAVTAAFYKD